MSQSVRIASMRARDDGGRPVDILDRVTELPERITEELRAFVSAREAEITADVARLFEVARDFLAGGKHLRSRFVYLGWLSHAAENPAAVRAAASLELLHAFALIQDDVMDGAVQRRGQPAVHISLATHHHESAAGADHDKFGESGATLLADLFLVWSEQMLRTSGLEPDRLRRAWDGFDEMRQELAIGQYLDLVNAGDDAPGFEQALRVARLKSARYTVTRPLLLGAHLAGAPQRVCRALSDYGDAVGEAFQMRDDVLGIFGDPTITGKPRGNDIQEGKATTLLSLASELASQTQRDELHRLRASGTEPRRIDRIQALITDTGARARLEDIIERRIDTATRAIDESVVPSPVSEMLMTMAHQCAHRDR